jgi:hypothetical protein
LSTINLNDATPAAPANFANVKFQNDASGNVSAYWSVGAWQPWSPTITPSGAMTISSVVIVDAGYFRIGPLLFYRLNATFAVGGTLNRDLIATLPVTQNPLTAAVGCNAFVSDTTGWYCYAVLPGTGTIIIRTPINVTGGIYTATANQMYVEGFYRV